MIYQSPFPTPHVPTDLSISQFLLAQNPDDVPHNKEIISDFDHRAHALSYGELRTRAARAASYLENCMNVREGDVVCIYGQNSVNWLLLAHSIFWVGGCASLINPAATSYELQHYFSMAKPKIMAVDAHMLPTAREALRESSLAGNVQILIIEDFTSHADRWKGPVFPKDFVRFHNSSLPPFDLRGRNNKEVPAAMCFSSGTSGKPKGVVLTHYNLIAYLLTVRLTNPNTHSSQTTEVFFPSFAHVYGLISAVLLTAYVGCRVRSSEIRSTILRLVPALAIRMTKDPDIKKLNLKSVKAVMVSGATLASATVRDLQQLLSSDAAVLNGYGMTEMTLTMLRETQSHRAGSVGRPAAGVSIRIANDDLKDVNPGEVGECLAKGPTLFLQYKDNPEETRSSFTDDGWFRTGDLLRVDEHGYFWVTGRKKELIKYKGNQVSPAEIEGLLLSHPLVVEAGVCGIDNGDTELPTGCVVLAPEVKAVDSSNTLKDISKFLEERVAPFKRLRGGLYQLESLPKGSTGKLLRRELPAIISKKLKIQAKI
ncbi:acyl-CoA synthetases/AMP-acid ligases II [Xylariaceae sp. FL0255]|nr:acyl-CoA synthetases/AMP-acid ligases II [Xylariaceae sp. FL0255]